MLCCRDILGTAQETARLKKKRLSDLHCGGNCNREPLLRESLNQICARLLRMVVPDFLRVGTVRTLGFAVEEITEDVMRLVQGFTAWNGGREVDLWVWNQGLD